MTIFRASLPALALLTSIASAQAQTPTQTQDHQAHHPAGQAEPAQPAPAPAPDAGQQPAGMMGKGPGMGMMSCPMMGQDRAAGGMQGMQMPGGMGMPHEYIDGRLAFLKAEIGITDDQASAWNALAETLRRDAGAHRSMRQRMMDAKSAPSSWPERLERQAQMLAARSESLKAVGAATAALYAKLSPEQREKADTLLSGPMGMGMQMMPK